MQNATAKQTGYKYKMTNDQTKSEKTETKSYPQLLKHTRTLPVTRH